MIRIKKLPPWRREDVVSFDDNCAPLTAILGNWAVQLCCERDGHVLSFYLSAFHCGMWMFDGNRLCLRDDGKVEEYNKLVWAWYLQAHENMQRELEEQITFLYLEDDD